jgi:hypothetical protein
VRKRAIVVSSVIVHDLNRFRAFGRPPETDAPLWIDPDGMLSAPVVLQRFEPVARTINGFWNVRSKKGAACAAPFSSFDWIGFR